MRGAAATVIGLILSGAVLATAAPPPPVLQDLGDVNPTPDPTPRSYRKKRLIESITIKNTAEGETTVTFEATDVGEHAKGKFKTLAREEYTLNQEKPKLKERRERVLQRVRALEEELLDYVKAAGPPRERATLLNDPHGYGD